MNTSPSDLRRQIRQELAAVAPETWEPAELAIVLYALTLITKNRRELAEKPAAPVLKLVAAGNQPN